MAKVVWTEDEEQFDKSHPGCMYGIFHALNYQLWHSNVKKISQHKKHEALVKHAKRNRRYKRISDDQDPFEVLNLLDAKTSHILVDQSNKKTSSNHKRSLKARIKALVSEHNDKKQDPKVLPSPKLQRTYSIHHLENNQLTDPRDILNILQDCPQTCDIKPKLTKSGSYPTSYKPGSRNLIMPMKLKDKLNEFYTVSKPENKLNSSNSHVHLRRISSLNESTNRYARLFDFSVGKEVVLRPSRSLKSTNAEEPSFFKSSSQNERNSVFVRLSTDKCAELNSSEDRECLNEVIDKSDYFSEIENSIDEKVQISEGFQENLEKEIKIVHNKKHTKSSRHYHDDDDFTYVKKILERSGFINNGFEQTWYSSNQPLDPFVFQEIESQYFHDPKLFAKEIIELSHHLLIFDLVDDVLVKIHERSSTYYPKPLSCSNRTESRVLDEVCKRVSRLVNLKPDMNESLDDIVCRDLGSDDGWMNLHLDLECVGFDLEDLILDEVIEEVLFESFSV